MDNLFSEKEQKLLDFIKTSEEDVTIGLIETQLGKEYVGALGKLINKEIVESDKKKKETGIFNSTYNNYSTKWIKYYKIKEEQK